MLSQYIYTVAQKERIFSNNCNFFYFQYKKIVNTKTTCNKCSFDYLHWLLNYGKLYRKDGVLLAVRTSGTSPQSSASHLLTFLVTQLQFLCEWKLSDHWLYEVFEHRLLIWGNPKERNRRQIQKHAFFLRHPVYIYIYKAIPLQTWTGRQGSRRLRLPDFMSIGTWRW